jgi:hypothetical protein
MGKAADILWQLCLPQTRRLQHVRLATLRPRLASSYARRKTLYKACGALHIQVSTCAYVDAKLCTCLRVCTYVSHSAA